MTFNTFMNSFREVQGFSGELSYVASAMSAINISFDQINGMQDGNKRIHMLDII